ncbi:MAG: hypothetical protein Q8L78_00710 [Coxiellaceae bacterium]|nr:hypothetical protein [Coxiellaceae bacterium]
MHNEKYTNDVLDYLIETNEAFSIQGINLFSNYAFFELVYAAVNVVFFRETLETAASTFFDNIVEANPESPSMRPC